MSILLTLLILGVIILIHELGHFLAARMFKIPVSEFAIGMGPKIFSQFDKEGTSKLKSTVEDELGDVIDRIDVLTSEDCKYNTFSGKDKAMDGNVKFVIETDAIE